MHTMEDAVLYGALISLMFVLIASKLLLPIRTRYKNLPPGPPSLPVIGHLHLLQHPVHRTLLKLSQKYGPIFSLRFGSRPVVVISSPAAVKECFGKNDVVLANRPQLLFGKHIGYNHSIVVTSPYGDHWRTLRRLGANEIFSSSRLNIFLETRKDEVRRLLCTLSSKSTNSFEEFSKVEMRSLFSGMAFNIVMRMAAGKRYHGNDVQVKEEATQFEEIIKQVVAHAGGANAGDYLPILNWITPNSFEKRMMKLAKRTDTFLQGLIDEHRSKKEEGRNTMIDHLLSLQESQPDYYSDQIIKGHVLVLILAGVDTSAVTLEWAMSNLLNNPEVLTKARAELDSQIGQERLFAESDLSKLPYLQGIISETHRLNPALPLLFPHLSSEDCTIGGYDVPQDTIVLVNAWAIHRDPNVWVEPTKFMPERHMNEETGQAQHKLIPFGVGRRACPGAGMAHKVVGLALGSLIQCFEWKRVNDQELLGMDEGEGLTMPKAVALEAMCKSRSIMHKVLAGEGEGDIN